MRKLALTMFLHWQNSDKIVKIHFTQDIKKHGMSTDARVDFPTRLSAKHISQLAKLGFIDLYELTHPYSKFSANFATPIDRPAQYSVESITERRKNKSLAYRLHYGHGLAVEYSQDWQQLALDTKDYATLCNLMKSAHAHNV